MQSAAIRFFLPAFILSFSCLFASASVARAQTGTRSYPVRLTNSTFSAQTVQYHEANSSWKIEEVDAAAEPSETDTETGSDPESSESPETDTEEALVTAILETIFQRDTDSILESWSYHDPDSEAPEPETPGFEASVRSIFNSVVLLESENASKFQPGGRIVLHKSDQQILDGQILDADGSLLIVKIVLDQDAPQSENATIATERSADSETITTEATTTEATTTEVAEDEQDSASDTKPSESETDNADHPGSEADSANEKSEEQPADDETKTTSPATENSDEADTADKATESAAAEASNDDESADPAPAHSDEATTDAESAQANGNDESKSTDAIEEADEIQLPLELDDKLRIEPVFEPQPDPDGDAAELTRKVEQLARDVNLANWSDVQKFLQDLEPDNADKVFRHIVTGLAGGPERFGPEAENMDPSEFPKSYLTPADILQLTEIATTPVQIETWEPEEAPSGDAGTVEATNDDVADSKGAGQIEVPQGSEDLSREQLAQIPQNSKGDEDVESDADSETEEPDGPTLVQIFAQLIVNSRNDGHDFADFISTVAKGTKYFGHADRTTRLTTADLFMKSGFVDEVQQYLPDLAEESTQNDLEALKIWSDLSMANFSGKRIAEWLERAWKVNQRIMEIETPDDDRTAALARLIELAAKVDEEAGTEWLHACIRGEPEHAQEIIAGLGRKSALMVSSPKKWSDHDRLRILKLQSQAVEQLVKAAPDQAAEWNQAISILGRNWLTEAELSVKHTQNNSSNARMETDMYGNYYWVDPEDEDYDYDSRQNRPNTIGVADLIELLPGPEWRKHISSSLHTQILKTTTRLHLRVNEEEKAFPYIKQVSKARPGIARELAEEFLQVWTQNHDPNNSRRRRNPYYYSYGYNQRADAIPLTRSSQQRNLKELSDWIDRIRKLDLDIDELKLANAFTACHSNAEVFELEAFQNVFGDLESLKPKTVAALCEKMRANLASNWRDVKNQEVNKTRRREPEIRAEVLRGYKVALKLINAALRAAPDDWELHLTKACLMFDEVDYTASVQKSSAYTARRQWAYDQFAKAAQKYADVAPTLEEKKQSTKVFDRWFYAALGSCDIGRITDETSPAPKEYEKIRKAITNLPGPVAEEHMADFANNLFTRMSPLKPEIKFRYLRAGFDIVGDHPRAREAKKLYQYYRDLVSEIRISIEPDGDVEVGHDEPFGLYVNLIHTKDIERESGGFGKYAQNQNSMSYSYNYGRPSEDYRDKFVNSMSLALAEHFEIISVTFRGADQMESVPTQQHGWRVTPYAYILLKSRGPEVDRIAPLQIDMDFLDTSGYVVIPIESNAVVIDSYDTEKLRPFEELAVTQTLDERQADESRLILEVSASAKGLVPPIEKILDLEREGFEVTNIDDQGVLAKSFDQETRLPQIMSERSWSVEYRATEGEGKPTSFSFADSKLDNVESVFQRYQDADLVKVDQVISLEQEYGSVSWAFLYWLIPAVLLGIAAIVGLAFALTRDKPVAKSRYEVPEEVNPFTVLSLLKDIRQNNGIGQEKVADLDQSINRIEAYYFERTDSDAIQQDNSTNGSSDHHAQNGTPPFDLAELATHWVRTVR